MSKYSEYSVKILLEKGGELEQRIQRLAAIRGVSFAEALSSVVDFGLWPFMEQNMAMLERVYEISGDCAPKA